MRLRRLPQLHDIGKNWFFWLLLITGIAIILRVLPALTNAAWGCDFGIYYGLTNSLVENKELFNAYYGWGESYQYFPVLYAITGAAHWITGIDVLTLLPKIAPIFGGLSVFIFYFVVRELTGKKKIALLSTLFLAVLPFHVYQTSHAAPLTMGHFFMMLSLYLFIKYRQHIRHAIPLLISTILLIMSHHLTTYFYFISLIFIVFIENAGKREWTPSIRRDCAYILVTSGLVFFYWAQVAKPVYDSFMRSGFTIGGIYIDASHTVVLFYMLFFSMFGVVWLKRRLNLFVVKEKPTVKSSLIKFSLMVLICLTAMIVFSVIKMPWTNFSFTPLSIVYSIPLILILGFSMIGIQYMRFIENGGFIKGWVLALIVSFIYGLITNSGVILPHRHLEYIMAPISVLCTYGLTGIFSTINHRRFSKWHEKLLYLPKPFFSLSKKPRLLQKRQLIYMIVIVVLVTTNAVSVYPSHVALNASYEAITNEDLSAIDWINENLNKNTSIIASDHRLARMVEAEGFNTTLDDAYVIWAAENLSDYSHELQGIGKNYSGRITHVVIDDIMRDKVVHVGFGNIVYMTNETTQTAYEKFLQHPFGLIYRNATIDKNMKELHWVEVYEVNWTYLEDYPRETQADLLVWRANTFS